MKNKIFYGLLTAALFAGLGTAASAQLFGDEIADNEFSRGNYRKALEYYNEMAAKDRSGKYLYKIADCELELKNYAEAEKHYASYLEKHHSPLSVRLNYAQALMYTGNYNAAREQLVLFKNGNPSKDASRADVMLKSIDYAQQHAETDTNEKFSIIKSNIQTGGLYLGGNSFRDALLTTKPADANADAPQYSFASYPYGLDKPYTAVTYTDSINNKFYMGAPSFTGDCKTMYFTANKSAADKASPKQYSKSNLSSSGRNTLTIFRSSLKDGKWTDITPLPFTSTEFSDTHPFITPDGRHLYFASNRPGGFGGFDIYYCKSEGKDKWSAPLNLGGKINTPYDELNPFALGDTMLYFSSEGKTGYGGADIYYCRGQEHRWGEPENMGPGFNSFADDFGISFDTSGTYGLFASNRDTRKGVDEIWYFSRVITYINGGGMTKDKFNGTTLPGVQISIFEQGRTEPVATLTSDKDGNYNYDKFEPNKKYLIRGDREGYLRREVQVDPQFTAMDKIDLSLDPKLKKNDVFAFKDILFEYNKADLLPASVSTLNRLAELLIVNSEAIVELSAHTDCRGNDGYNDRLSQRRAESAVNYLVSMGVNADRIIAVGYGERKLKNRCRDGVPCSEEEHEVNRRVEIKVVDMKQLSQM